MGNIDGFLTIADYNEYPGRISEPFARHDLRETRAKPPASGDGLSNNKRPYPRSVDMVEQGITQQQELVVIDADELSITGAMLNIYITIQEVYYASVLKYHSK
jgi:hypothetical protein